MGGGLGLGHAPAADEEELVLRHEAFDDGLRAHDVAVGVAHHAVEDSSHWGEGTACGGSFKFREPSFKEDQRPGSDAGDVLSNDRQPPSRIPHPASSFIRHGAVLPRTKFTAT